MTDETKPEPSDFEKRVDGLSPEQVAQMKSIVDKAHAKHTGSNNEDAAITHGSDNDAKDIIRRKYGYTPQF